MEKRLILFSFIIVRSIIACRKEVCWIPNNRLPIRIELVFLFSFFFFQSGFTGILLLYLTHPANWQLDLVGHSSGGWRQIVSLHWANINPPGQEEPPRLEVTSHLFLAYAPAWKHYMSVCQHAVMISSLAWCFPFFCAEVTLTSYW